MNACVRHHTSAKTKRFKFYSQLAADGPKTKANKRAMTMKATIKTELQSEMKEVQKEVKAVTAEVTQKKQRGFTLIELMIVVAIIGILAAIAIPQYQAYTGRAQAAEAITLFSGVKTTLGEYFNEKNCWPGDDANGCAIVTSANEDVGASLPIEINGTYIGSVTVAADGTGITTAAFTNGVHTGKTMIFTPTNNTGTIEWACAGVGIADSQLPSNCR
ncbi:MAG: pilin [Gammaproteobacteria bacterium]